MAEKMQSTEMSCPVYPRSVHKLTHAQDGDGGKCHGRLAGVVGWVRIKGMESDGGF